MPEKSDVNAVKSSVNKAKEKACFRCGRVDHLANDGRCAARNAQWRKCKKTGHCWKYLQIEQEAMAVLFGLQKMHTYIYGRHADKVKAIAHAPVPHDQAELRSFLGSFTYLTQFVPNLATVITPLRQLTQKGVVWKWSKTASKAFEEVKRASD